MSQSQYIFAFNGGQLTITQTLRAIPTVIIDPSVLNTIPPTQNPVSLVLSTSAVGEIMRMIRTAMDASNTTP